MPRERHDTDRLRIVPTAAGLHIALSTATAVDVRRTEHRCTIKLAFGRSKIGPDVSVQPGAVVEVIDQQARLVGADPNAWRARILRAVLDWEPSLAWCQLDAARLVAALGALTHPLLGAAYERGADAIGDIPRWASPLLRTGTPADAARAMTGGHTTRHLTRTLAAALLGTDHRIDLAPLSLAAAAAGLISTDELANVLDAGTDRTDRPPPPTVDDVKTIRAGMERYPSDRRAALLVDTATRHDPVTLADAMERLAWVDDRAPRPLPVRVADLIALCDRLVPVLAPPAPRPTPPDPPPTAPVADPRRTAVADSLPDLAATTTATPAPPTRAPTRRPPQTGRRALSAPVTTGSAPDRWRVPAALQPISGLRDGRLAFCVPTSTRELDWWGRQLRNCLDSFAIAAAGERSWLIGIRRDDELIGCIEVCPRTHRIRQAHGPRNRRLPDPVYESATRVLTRHGILR